MPFGMRTDLVYSEESELPAYTIVYEDGQATFSLDEEGHLIWTDEKENAGEGMLFEYIGEYVMEDVEADGLIRHSSSIS